MQPLKSHLRRLFFSLKHYYLTPSNIIPTVALILCAVWTASSLSAMSRNWRLNQILSKKQRELALLQLEVETAELENAYYRSEEYLELSARQKQNKQLPGEHLVYLPENTPAPIPDSAESEQKTVSEPSNFSQWMSFLFD